MSVIKVGVIDSMTIWNARKPHYVDYSCNAGVHIGEHTKMTKRGKIKYSRREKHKCYD